MPSMLAGVNLATTAQEIAATNTVEGLGVRNLLTEPRAEVWRAARILYQPIESLSVDSNIIGNGANTTRVGTVADPDGGTAAIGYTGGGSGSRYVGPTTFEVVAGERYRIRIAAIRVVPTGTLNGYLIRLTHPDGTVATLNLSGVITTSWGYYDIEFVPATSGTVTVWWLYNQTVPQVAIYNATVELISRTDLDITLPAPAQIGVIALFAPRDSYLPPTYTVEVLGSAVSLGASEALAVTEAPLDLVANRGCWWHWPASPVTLQYLRLRFRPGSSADDYLQFGNLWIGPDVRPTYGAAPDGYQRGWADSGTVERSAISGAVSASPGATYRVVSLTLPQLSDAEAYQIEDIAARVGSTRQVVVNARTQRGARDLVLGRFTTIPVPEPISPMLYRCAATVAEDL